MFPMDFFTSDDKKVKDQCPVCKHVFGTVYEKTERIYYCDECNSVLEFHPYTKEPRMTLKKKNSNFNVDYVPYEEDQWQLREIPPPDEPPSGPRKPPWYA